MKELEVLLELDWIYELLEPTLVLKDGLCVFANESFYHLSGLKESEVIDKEASYFLNTDNVTKEFQSEYQIRNSYDREIQCVVKFIDLKNSLELVSFRDVSVEVTLQEKYQDKIKELQLANSILDFDLKLALSKTSFILKGHGLIFFNIDYQGNIEESSVVNRNLIKDLPETILSLSFEDFSRAELLQWLELMASEESDPNELMEIAPEKFSHQQRIYRVKFYLDKLHGKLGLAIEDITKTEVLISEKRVSDLNLISLRKIFPNQKTYRLTLAEIDQHFRTLNDESIDESEARAALHSLKGIFSYYGPEYLMDEVHQIELRAAVLNEKELLQNLEANFFQFKSFLTELIPNMMAVENLELISQETFNLKELLKGSVGWIEELSEATTRKINIEIDCQLENAPVLYFGCISQFLIQSTRNALAHSLNPVGTDEELKLQLSCDYGDEMRIEVKANGFDGSSLKDPKLSGQGVGTKIMKKMAESLGGSFELKLEKNTSTSVLKIPQT